MNEHMPLDAQQRERLSALMDGQAEDAPAWDDMDDAQMRECWHLYHVVGDVLRSPELAHCADDAAFVARLRERMNAEVPPQRTDADSTMAPMDSTAMSAVPAPMSAINTPWGERMSMPQPSAAALGVSIR